MSRDDVIDVLTAVAAADRRTVGHADVDVWQAIIGELPKDLALRAVRDHMREEPGVWMEPGHVYQRVRAFMRDQLEREPDEFREVRQKALEAKAAEDADDQAAIKDGMAPIPRGVSPYIVHCTHPPCSAPPGRPCTAPTPSGDTRVLSYSRAHPIRIERAITERERTSPKAVAAAAEAARNDQIRALARYREQYPQLANSEPSPTREGNLSMTHHNNRVDDGPIKALKADA